MNRAFCNRCRRLVEARHERRGGEVFLVKECPDCGSTETRLSSDAGRYFAKQRLDGQHEEAIPCGLNCPDCAQKEPPNFVFVDVTNRCNSNCPICINNTPSMGFLFEPPFEYFERLFEGLAKFDPRPAVQLFGGEPTVREDLFDIIALARSHKLRVRVVTNGLRLANEAYCRELAGTRSTILFAYDGANPQTYRVLRGNERHLEIKQRALENLSRVSGAKVALMTCLAAGFNDDELADLLQFCHDRRDMIRGVYLMPLAQTWDHSEFDLEPERITTEDVEEMLNECYPGERIEFVPAGLLGELETLAQCIGLKRSPFAGAHPNCESMYMMVSDGERYVPAARYFKTGLHEAVEELLAVEGRLERLKVRLGFSREAPLPDGLSARKLFLRIAAMLLIVSGARRHLRIGGLVKGKGLGKVWHVLAGIAGRLSGKGTKEILGRHAALQGRLQVIVLPFEDPYSLETERLQRCPNGFAYYDGERDLVNYVPACAWGEHKSAVMRRIADFWAEQPVSA
jgi:hypothetical protein